MKERNNFILQTFLGVDFSTSPLKVDKRRAASGVNFITDYGTMKKRNGWIELIKFVDKKITAIFHYKNSLDDFMLIRAGNKFYRLNHDMTYTTLYTLEPISTEQISFFPSNDMVYIIGCGKYLVMLQNGVDAENKPLYVIHEVRNLATIPTTTISIDDTQSSVVSRAGLDQVNLLTSKRKNTLIGRDAINLEWLLDSPVKQVNNVLAKTYIEIEWFDGTQLQTKYYETFPEVTGLERYIFDADELSKVIGNAKGEIQIEIVGRTARYFAIASNIIEYEHAEYTLTLTNSGDVTADDILPLLQTQYPQYYEDLDLVYVNQLIMRVNETGGYSYWKLDYEGAIDPFGGYKRVKIYENTKPPLDGADNIIVTFESANVIDGSGIQNATSGIVFGVNGTTNQLFVANGATEYYSMPFDFNYFPDTFVNVLGNKSNPIVGYSRLSDTGLVIYKDKRAGESRLFFRQMELAADTTLLDYQYRLFDRAVDVNIGCDASGSIENLTGDSLFLSRSGVWAVTLGENISVESRHVRERSIYINKHLADKDIKNAKAIVFDNRYYLAVGDSVYVADARYRSASDMDDTFNYEWFYWENIPVNVWAVINDELYFGTVEGRLCKFDQEFSDRTMIRASEGDVTLVVSGNYLVYNQEIEVKNNDHIKVSCYEKLIPSADMTIVDGLISLPYVVDGMLLDDMEVYIQGSGSGLTEEVVYTISDLDSDSFRLKNALGEYVTPTAGFNLLEDLSEIDMLTTNVDDVNNRFQLKRYDLGSPIEIATYNADPLTFVITIHEPVSMVWYTPIFDLGSNMFAKTLLAMTVSADASTTGEIKFGYDTRNISANIQSLNFKSFTFDDIDFNNFTFLTAIASSYTIRVKEKDFNFIILKFGSESPTSAVINNVNLMYKINSMNRGIR